MVLFTAAGLHDLNIHCSDQFHQIFSISDGDGGDYRKLWKLSAAMSDINLYPPTPSLAQTVGGGGDTINNNKNIKNTENLSLCLTW